MSPEINDEADRWQWRSQLRDHPGRERLYRIGVAVVGFIVVVVGIILLPFPGPGWVVIFVGLGIWASEFEWAQALLWWVRRRVEEWWSWLDDRGWWAKALAACATAAVVILIFWALFAISGVPGWFPAPVRRWLGHVPGLAG